MLETRSDFARSIEKLGQRNQGLMCSIVPSSQVLDLPHRCMLVWIPFPLALKASLPLCRSRYVIFSFCYVLRYTPLVMLNVSERRTFELLRVPIHSLLHDPIGLR